MEYNTIKDLPASISMVLPQEAQELYLETYKEAWAMYDQEISGGLDQPAVAHRDAWAVVTEHFERDPKTGEWHRKGQEIQEEESKGLIDKIKDLF
jgi:cation transport regulator ChaB